MGGLGGCVGVVCYRNSQPPPLVGRKSKSGLSLALFFAPSSHDTPPIILTNHPDFDLQLPLGVPTFTLTPSLDYTPPYAQLLREQLKTYYICHPTLCAIITHHYLSWYRLLALMAILPAVSNRDNSQNWYFRNKQQRPLTIPSRKLLPAHCIGWRIEID